MIFKKLTFKNYKTYYGVQEVDLHIPENVTQDEKRNIILLGGLNGAGKTTFLKAILYILFGKRGITNSTSKTVIEAEYKKLFSNVINNTYFEEGGRDCSASLVLETDAGEEWTLSVKWHVDSFKIISQEEREIAIKKPGSNIPKKMMIQQMDSYNRLIDSVIPFHAVPFVIFDGEEIRTLVEKQNTEEMKDAIKKISGIQSNDQLIEDLYQLKTKLQKDIAKISNSVKVDKLQSELDNVNAELSSTREKSAKYAKLIEEETTQRDALQEARKEKLLHNSKSRETISVKLGSIKANLAAAEKELEQHFQNDMFSIILAKNITKLKSRLQVEKNVREKKLLQQTQLETKLQPYEKFIMQLLETAINPPLTLEQKTQLKENGESVWLKLNNQKQVEIPNLLELHDLNKNDLNYLSSLPITNASKVTNLINTIDRLKSEQEEILLQLQNAPEAADTSIEEEQIRKKTEQIAKYQMFKQSFDKKIRTYLEEKRSLETQLSKNVAVGGNADQLYAEMQYLDRTIKALIKYEEEYTALKTSIIKTEFESMLKKLFRKQDEFGKIEFDTETYSIRLYNDKMREISLHDRSAGEMQMISSAFIWALTRASNLKLPVVIDTPLGRLDSYHRSHLIEHYYRHLGHQVIILSTDTEITRDYIELMEKSSYKQYMLDYNEEKKYTIIRDGYFKFIKENR
ncbi:DNA sulfur modification protein DndD [Caryophanon latum]|uniref:Nuclease SbcCD subunit C n=1 Tax=Caryophanon latum TaxID=33977 RepID=A0A1C0YJC5_9BACL|nr:DNA sulfur modification protein DndD [Caryophanon latum]OCS87287.1 DNA sulfur modification protein DndD [Caryophanon latum]